MGYSVSRLEGDAVLSLMGIPVVKSVNLASAGDVFNVTGTVLLNLLYGEVTTVVATTTTFKLRRKTDNVDMCAATTITTDAVGTMYYFSGDAGAILSGTLAAGDAPVVGLAHLAGGPASPMIFGRTGRTATIEAVLDGAGTGIIRWKLFYIPLEAGAKVVAA